MWVALHLERAETHVQRVDQQQAPHQRLAHAQDQFDGLDGLDRADDARQHAQHARLGAARHLARGRRFGIETAVAWPARDAVFRRIGQVDGRLALKHEDAAVNERLAQHVARIVDQVARREVVRPVEHDVVLADNLQRVVARQRCVVRHHLHVRVDVVQPIPGGLDLGPAHVLVAVQKLALQVGDVDHVEVDDAQRAHPGRGQVHGRRTAQPARTDK